MPDPQHLRVTRELSAAAFGINMAQAANPPEPWVTDRLVSIAEEGFARAGDVLFAPGDAADVIRFVRTGNVLLSDGPSRPREVHGPVVIGLLDVLLDRAHTERATARGDLAYYRVRAERWFDLLEDSFPLARASVMAQVRTVAALEENAWSRRPPSASASHPPWALSGPMSVLDRLGVLMDIPLLRGAGVQVLSDLASVAEEVRFEPGAAILTRGRRADRFFVIVTGEVEASREGPRITWRGGPGQMVCDVAWLAEGVPAWRARAATPVRALSFRVEDWFDLLEEHFEMVRATLRALARQREELSLDGVLLPVK
jgi:CRP-like cAMP-binding protein